MGITDADTYQYPYSDCCPHEYAWICMANEATSTPLHREKQRSIHFIFSIWIICRKESPLFCPVTVSGEQTVNTQTLQTRQPGNVSFTIITGCSMLEWMNSLVLPILVDMLCVPSECWRCLQWCPKCERCPLYPFHSRLYRQSHSRAQTSGFGSPGSSWSDNQKTSWVRVLARIRIRRERNAVTDLIRL